MADNTTLNSGSGGNVMRDLEDSSSVHWPVGVLAWATTVSAGANVLTIPTAAALADNTANPTTVIGASCVMLYDGTTWDRARGDSTNGMLVNLGGNNDVTLATLPDTAAGDLAAINSAVSGTLTVGSHAVTNAGTFVVQEDGAALTALQLIDDVVYADDADWTDGTSKHALVGGLYQSTPQTITDGDVGPFQVTSNGYLIVSVNGTVTVDASGTTVPVSNTGLTELAAAINSSRVDVNIAADGVSLATEATLGSVQTAVELIDDAVYVDDADWTDSSSKHVLTGGLYQSVPQTITDGDVGPFQVTSNGYLIVSVNGTVTVDASGTTVPVSNAGLTELAAAINTNRVDVNLAASAVTQTVDNAGTFAVQEDGAALTALQLLDNSIVVDDAAFTPATTSVNMAGFEFDDTTPDSVDEGDAGAARMSANRNIYIQLRDAAGNERGVNVDASNQLQVTGPVTNAGTFVVQEDGAALTSLQLIDDAVYADDADWTDSTSKHMLVGGLYQSVPQTITDGDVGPFQVTANGYLITSVNGTVTVGSHDVTNAGTFVVQEDGAALTALQLLDNSIVVDDAAFTPATTSVNMAGFEFDDVTPDSVDEGDAGAARMSANRNQYVQIRDGAGNERGANVDASGNLQVDIAADSVGIGGGTQYAVDTALGATPTGTLAVAIRDDALSALTPVEGDAIGLRVDANGALWVIPSGTTTVTDDGSFTLAANSGVDIGDVDVLSVVPGTGATNLGKAIDTASGATDTGVASLAIRDDTLSTLTPIEGDWVPLRVNSTGALHVTGAGGGTQYAVDDALGATPTGTLAVAIRDDALSALTPVEGDAIGLRVDANGALWVIPSGTTTVDNAGTFAVQVDGDALTALQLIDDPVATLGTTTYTETTTKGMIVGAVRNDVLAALANTDNEIAPLQVDSAGAMYVRDRVSHQDDSAWTSGTNFFYPVGLHREDTPNNLADGAAGTFRGSSNRCQYTMISDGAENERRANVNASNQLQVQLAAEATGGATIFRSIDLDETEEEVKATAGTVYGWYLYNDHASAKRYIKFYNATAATVVVGTTPPVLTIPLDAGQGANVEFTRGIEFSTAITVAATTGIADNDTGAPGANEVIANIFYE